jgi:oligoribonuclease NrnB/cAMP/cGMP phosphodiesterase (DHH superfamily)
MKAIFTHRKDLDGIACAAIFKRAYNDVKIFLLDYGEEEALQMLNHMEEIAKNDDNNLFVISDIGINKPVANLLYEGFRKIISSTLKICWFDHHVWPDELKIKFNDIIELSIETDKCASEIVADEFCKSDEICELLSSIARDSDFKLNKYKITELLDDIIAYYNYTHDYEKLKDLASKLAQGILWDANSQKIWDNYILERNKAIEELKRNYKKLSINSKVVAISIVNDIIPSSMAVNILLKESKSDIAIAVRERGTLTIMRNKDSNIECNKIAEFFGGGGHPFIAGGKLPKDLVEKRDYDLWINYIADILKNSLKSS